MGFERWEMGFANKTGWEMGLVPPLHDRLDDAVVTSARLVDTSERMGTGLKSHFLFQYLTVVSH